jgi:hypothetical protein
MPAGNTDSCFTDVPCRDAFIRVTRTDITEGFERVRDRRWNKPRWAVINGPGNRDEEVDAMTKRERLRWNNRSEEEYRQENRILRESYRGRGCGGTSKRGL